MARRNERYSWQEDWKDDGEDRPLSERPKVTEASFESCADDSSIVVSGARCRCDELFRKDSELDYEKKETAQQRVMLFSVRAKSKEYLN